MTIDTESDALRTAILRLATSHGATVRVEDLDKLAAERAENFASATWLAERVYDHLSVKATAPASTTKEALQKQLRTFRLATVVAITQLTLEEFLERTPWPLVEPIFEVIAESGVTFADGADPAEFLQDKFEKNTSVGMIPYLWRAGVISWAMFPYLSPGFVKGIVGISTRRLNSIREILKSRGLALKGEGN